MSTPWARCQCLGQTSTTSSTQFWSPVRKYSGVPLLHHWGWTLPGCCLWFEVHVGYRKTNSELELTASSLKIFCLFLWPLHCHSESQHDFLGSFCYCCCCCYNVTLEAGYIIKKRNLFSSHFGRPQVQEVSQYHWLGSGEWPRNEWYHHIMRSHGKIGSHRFRCQVCYYIITVLE